MRTDQEPPRRSLAPHLPSPALPPALVAALRAQVPSLAELTVTSVAAEVSPYSAALHGNYRTVLEDGVRMAYDNFLDLLVDGAGASEAALDGALARARRGAHALGRGEARAGRNVEALLAAYRVGARVHWRELSRVALRHGLTADGVADLAALILGYNHELSAASVAGHEDETATLRRVRERHLERLANALINGEAPDLLAARAERGGWNPPRTLTAVLLPAQHADTLLAAFPGTLSLPVDASGLPDDQELTVLLVPDVHHARDALLRAVAGSTPTVTGSTPTVVGPARPWTQTQVSYRRAVRALTLPRPSDHSPLDTERHLGELLVTADPEALTDLRSQVLEPLADLPAATAARLATTLRSWLLHQGRRDDVAADLHVHPQTVRYRMTQIRDRFGPALTDPEHVLQLILALARPTPDDQPRGQAIATEQLTKETAAAP
jgi:PucR C-terminal helix-turn-helix domain/GGDEF-like domain